MKTTVDISVKVQLLSTENELGETALDVSRKLKHGDCEALVRSQ